MPRPLLFVLAGVNGAGKSSVGGAELRKRGLAWFNPDTRTRELLASGFPLDEANSRAWHEGLALFDARIARGENHAFETTLGGRTITDRIRRASETHDIEIWYCSLATADMHIERVRRRVLEGGHDIPEGKIRERWERAPANLIALMPHVTHLLLVDNSAPPDPEGTVRPTVVAQVHDRELLRPRPEDASALEHVPAWAKPIVDAALRTFSLRPDAGPAPHG